MPPPRPRTGRADATIHGRIAAGRAALIAAGFRAQDAALDADVLARHVLGWDRARLLASARDVPPSGFDARYATAIDRRIRHEPVAMITGTREFWGLDFLVTPDTLIPRPETEFIVEEALRILPADRAATVLDVGTGTGCLAVALASERPLATVVATDISREALLVARENARRHGVKERVRFVQTDLSSGLATRVELAVSNPPYVPDGAAAGLAPEVVSHEPHRALFGGPDGLAILRRLFDELPPRLAGGGRFIVEFGYGQEDAARGAAADAGWIVERVLHDLQDIARTLVLRR